MSNLGAARVAAMDGVEHTSPRRRRREIIMTAAAGLFSKHGYTAVGMDQIGAAAGITGPGVYRHFKTKPDLLAAIIEEEIRRLSSSPDAPSAVIADPRADLEVIIARLVSAVLQEPFLIVAFHEEHDFPVAARKRLAAARRELGASAVAAARRVHPDLDRDEVELAFVGVSGLLDVVGRSGKSRKVEPRRLSELMVQWAMSMLLFEGQTASAAKPRLTVSR